MPVVQAALESPSARPPASHLYFNPACSSGTYTPREGICEAVCPFKVNRSFEFSEYLTVYSQTHPGEARLCGIYCKVDIKHRFSAVVCQRSVSQMA